MPPLLEVRELHREFRTGADVVRAANDFACAGAPDSDAHISVSRALHRRMGEVPSSIDSAPSWSTPARRCGWSCVK
jgi:hypothetical protein